MWKFRVYRPILFFVGLIDVLFCIAFWIMLANHVSLNHWVVSITTSWIFANLVIIWRDGVN